MCDRENDFTEVNSAQLGNKCVWHTEEYPTSAYYVRIVVNNTIGSTTSEFQFDALKSGE